MCYNVLTGDIAGRLQPGRDSNCDRASCQLKAEQEERGICSMKDRNNIIRISVRNLVEFLLRSGSLDTGAGAWPETAMLEGARIHRALQKKAGQDYRAEVMLRMDVPVDLSPDAAAERIRAQDMLLHVPQDVKPDEWPDRMPDEKPDEKPDTEKSTALCAGPEKAACGSQESTQESNEAVLRLEGRADGIFFMRKADGEPENPFSSSSKKRRKKESDHSKQSEQSKQSDQPDQSDQSDQDGLWTIDEIKTVLRGLQSMDGPEEVHLAQARCYAYMYACRERLGRVKIRMTYCSQVTEEVRCFYEEMSFEVLEEWFRELVRAYEPWMRLRLSFDDDRQKTIRQMVFPFPYREGQYELAAGVYRTIVHGKKLFLQAPTGTGKTMAVLFPSLKAIGEGKAERIFYLTAKGVTGAVAMEALSLLKERGLSIRSLSLVSKERACPFEEADCRPESCPRADGHFDRVNEALLDLLQGAAEGSPITTQVIAACAQKHRVCPYSLSLDAADFADVIICDYNYVFHPQARLTRFFGDPAYTEVPPEEADAEKGDPVEKTASGNESSEGFKSASRDDNNNRNDNNNKNDNNNRNANLNRSKKAAGKRAAGNGTILLIDEAHNLLERGRDMYSAEISYSQVRSFRKSVKKLHPRLWKKMKGLVHVLRELQAEADEQKIHVLGDWTLQKGPDRTVACAEPAEKTKEEGTAAAADAAAALPELYNAVEEVRDQIRWILDQEKRSTVLYGTIRTGGADKGQLGDNASGDGWSEDGLFENGSPENENGSSEAGLPEAGRSGPEQAGAPEMLEFYFGLSHFSQILRDLDAHYIVYTSKGGKGFSGGFSLHLYCADPSGHLRACMKGLTSAVLFSATFLPIQYYKGLLGGCGGDFEMYARSSFSPEQRKVVIVSDVTSRYRDRSEETYARIARSIGQIVDCRPGNYIAYFPSYAFLEKVLEAFCAIRHPAMNGEPDKEGLYVIVQTRDMKDSGREAFLEAFEEAGNDRRLVGFCVLGGMFGEGIDLRSERLIGSLIVGTGIPPVEPQRELLREYFSGQGRNGYDFAYRFPGMNKVLQAAGRVIRTAEDVGIVVLMDDRFSESSNRELYPLEWGQPESVNSETAAGMIRLFWEKTI